MPPRGRELRAAATPGGHAGPGGSGRAGERRADRSAGWARGERLVLAAPRGERAAQLAERDEADRRGQPDRDRAVGEHGHDREVGLDAERQQRADQAAADGARDRDRVADLAEEVREHDDGERAAARRTRSASPTARTCRSPTRRSAPSSRTSSERTWPIASRTAPPMTDGGRARACPRPSAAARRAVSGSSMPSSRHAGRRARSARAARPRPPAASRSRRPTPKKIEYTSTRNVSSVRVAPRVPRPERRSAHRVRAAPPAPAVGSRPGRGGAAQRDLGRLAQAQARGGAAARPATAGRCSRRTRRARTRRRRCTQRGSASTARLERVGERLERPAEDHDRDDQRGGSGSGQSGPARQCTEIRCSEREVLGGHAPSIGTEGRPAHRGYHQTGGAVSRTATRAVSAARAGSRSGP